MTKHYTAAYHIAGRWDYERVSYARNQHLKHMSCAAVVPKRWSKYTTSKCKNRGKVAFLG